MHIALYREFRPVTFDELIGQDHIVRILKNQIKTGSTSHAYLFSGTRGTGKTTTARILAKALNCSGDGEKPCGHCENCRSFADGSFVDVIEMDAASHRGVNDIHEITDSVMYAPAAGKYKVYIIDEVHMLSNEAFNALLKTLEEPPEHVVFILATTEPQKVPSTILSRCMKLDFRRVSEKQLVENMKSICEKKQIVAEQGALSLIAVSADGSVRDSLSILEQCICPGEPLRRDDAAAVLGTAGVEPLLNLTDLVLAGDVSGALLRLNEILSSGSETRQFMKEWLGHFRNLLISKYVQNPWDILNMSTENADRVAEQSGRISQQMLDRAIRELTETISLTKWAKHPRVMLEMSVVKLSAPAESTPARAENAPVHAERTPLREENTPVRNESLQNGMPKPETPKPETPEPETLKPEKPTVPDQPLRVEQNAFPSPENSLPDAAVPPDIPEMPELPPDIPGMSSTANMPAEERIPSDPDPDVFSEVPGEETEAPLSGQKPPLDSADSRTPSFTEEDWNHTVKSAAASKGILTRLIGRTQFRSQKDEKIFILCNDPATADLLRGRGKETVERILLQITGRPLSIVAEVREADKDSSTDFTENEQEQLNLFFGREVPIE